MKKKQKFVSSQSYNHAIHSRPEDVTGESLTVSGEAYTVQELFERYAQGQIPNIRDNSYWEETSDFDSIDFNQLRYADPYEKAELLEEVKQKAEKAQKALKDWISSKETEDEPTSKSKPKNPKSEAAEDGEPASERSDASDANSSEAKTKK